MQREQFIDFSEAFSFERKLLLFSGLYPSHEKNRKWILKMFVLFFFSLGFLATMVAQVIVDRNELSKLTEPLVLCFTHLTFIFKLSNFLYHRSKLLEVERDLEFFGRVPLQVPIRRKFKNCSFVSMAFRINCILAMSSVAMVPYIDASKKNSLPVSGWFPYDTTGKFYFPTMAFQIMSYAVSAYNNSGFDTLTWMLICVSAAQFDVLKDNLTKIDYCRVTAKKPPEDCLKRCIQYYFKSIRLARKIEMIFSNGIFLQIFSSVGIICVSCFQIIMVPKPSVGFVFLTSYLFSMIYQIAWYCWYGHAITWNSDEIGKCFYMSNWYKSDMKTRKTIMIFLEIAKKPVVLYAGRLIPLTVVTLITILRSSYSYFAVLQSLIEE